MARRSWKVKMGRLVRVPNKGRKFGAVAAYNLVKCQRATGKEEYLLFTDHQIKVARDRARKNPEDIVKSARLVDLLD